MTELYRVAWSSVPTQKQYRKMVMQVRGELRGAIDLLAAGYIGPQEFADIADEILTRGHTKAIGLGRHLAGDLRVNEIVDAQVASLAMDRQAEYLQNFADKIAEGGYEDEFGLLDKDKVARRCDSYLHAMRGSANESFVSASGPDDLIDWKTTTPNCPDCNAVQARGPFKASAMTQFPGDCQTRCLYACDCYLVRRKDRRRGFGKLEFD